MIYDRLFCFDFIYRGKNTLGYSDSELANMGGYDLVHYDDLAYVASAHQEREYETINRQELALHFKTFFHLGYFSTKNGSLGNDRLSVSEEGWCMAMAANKL